MVLYLYDHVSSQPLQSMRDWPSAGCNSFLFGKVQQKQGIKFIVFLFRVNFMSMSLAWCGDGRELSCLLLKTVKPWFSRFQDKLIQSWYYSILFTQKPWNFFTRSSRKAELWLNIIEKVFRLSINDVVMEQLQKN